MSEHQPGRDLAARAAALRAHDPDFTASVPSPEVADAIRACDGGLVATIEAAMRGYADRPALARRAERVVRDAATGRSIRELLPAFETVSYAELWRRVGRLATAWADPAGAGLRPGDFVATLGFTGVDYAVIDLACMYLGTVSVPLATGAPATRLAPVVAETGPRLLAADIGSLDAAVDTVLASDTVERLVVFDCDPRVDDHREALRAAADKLDGRAAVAPLADELRRGAELPCAAPHEGDPERLAGLIYTSGSTGTPKGAIYTAAMITRMWQKACGGMAAVDGIPVPTIVLHYMPMSHVNGRSWLVSALASGGIGHFAARGDLSTLFDDIRLSRPTVLSLVPRICDMVHQRHLLESERRTRGGTARPEAEAAARDHVRDGMLGGRIMSALCGSAPLSAAMHTFMGDVLGTKIVDCYGSTETTRAVIVDQQVRRPPILDYRLVDVPELGYFATDKPHPGASCGSGRPTWCPATTGSPRSPPAPSTRTATTAPATSSPRSSPTAWSTSTGSTTSSSSPRASSSRSPNWRRSTPPARPSPRSTSTAAASRRSCWRSSSPTGTGWGRPTTPPPARPSSTRCANSPTAPACTPTRSHRTS
ncbi:AMP-binding protein [Kitasatospora aburaviensis]